jgi:hypothetical protein
MEWIKGKTTIAGIQISNWMIVLSAIMGGWIWLSTDLS